MGNRTHEIQSFDIIDAAANAAYEEDGVVCLRKAFAPEWIALARAGVERNLAEPGPFFRDHTSAGAAGRYVFDFWTWPQIPEFRRLIHESPAGALAGQLLGGSKATMIMDNWFLREAGAVDAAPWHHDEPYFDFEGRMTILWLPLEHVGRQDGIQFVRGSHRLGQLFRAEQFSENVAFDCIGDRYAPMPDFAAEPDRWTLLTTELEPGDCLAFDFRAVHAGTSRARPLDHTIHRLTLRFAADNTVFRPRGPWTREISAHLIAQGQKIGATLECPLTPHVWTAPQAKQA